MQIDVEKNGLAIALRMVKLLSSNDFLQVEYNEVTIKNEVGDVLISNYCYIFIMKQILRKLKVSGIKCIKT
jgi:hypothetical protein